MPELPEVETVRTGLARSWIGSASMVLTYAVKPQVSIS